MASDLITTSEKVETSSCLKLFKKISKMFLSKVLSQFHNQNKTKQKKKLCACLHIKVAGREFPRKCFRLVTRASQGICCC